MARRAGWRKSLLCVIRIFGVLEVFEVAAHASRLRHLVVVVRVAIGTGPRRNHVAACQREPCEVVIEFRIQPVVGGMATVALNRKYPLRSHVVRILRGREILLVTAIARR